MSEDCGIAGCSGPVKGRGWHDKGRPKKIEAQFDSRCPDCGEEIEEGQTLYWSEFHEMYVCSPACR